MVKFRPGQPAFHMAEAVLIGNQLNVALPAVLIKFQDFFAGDRGFQLPDTREGFVRERSSFYI